MDEALWSGRFRRHRSAGNELGRRQAVRHRILISAFEGSIPSAPASRNERRAQRALRSGCRPAFDRGAHRITKSPSAKTDRATRSGGFDDAHDALRIETEMAIEIGDHSGLPELVDAKTVHAMSFDAA